MRRAVSIGLAAVLAIGVGYAVFGSTRHHDAGHGASSSAPTVVRGVSGSEKEPFFRDPAVAAVLARHGIKLEVDYRGSRKIATLPNLGQYDFVFPSGVPAAEKIRRERKVVARTEPFY